MFPWRLRHLCTDRSLWSVYHGRSRAGVKHLLTHGNTGAIPHLSLVEGPLGLGAVQAGKAAADPGGRQPRKASQGSVAELHVPSAAADSCWSVLRNLPFAQLQQVPHPTCQAHDCRQWSKRRSSGCLGVKDAERRLTSSSRIARALRSADRSATAPSSNLRSRSRYQRYLRKISVAVKPVFSLRPRTTPAWKAKLLSAFSLEEEARLLGPTS